MTDMLLEHLDNLILWVQNNPFTTVIIVVVVVVALLFVVSIISWLTD